MRRRRRRSPNHANETKVALSKLPARAVLLGIVTRVNVDLVDAGKTDTLCYAAVCPSAAE